MNRFLVGYDGSSRAREALFLAGRLAAGAGGYVTAIVVTPQDPPADTVGLATGCAADAARLLRTLRAPGTVEVRSGDPADVLVAAATTGGHHLIAIGHHSRGALRDMLLGSVAKRVLAAAPCPTLVVGKHAPSAPGRILVALDGSPESEAACDAGIALARACDARVLLVNVVDTAGLGAPRHAEVMAQLHVSNERAGVRVLAAAARRCARAGVALEVAQFRGLAAEQLVRNAVDRRVDLVAIGRSRRSQIERLTFGSVGDAILRRYDGAILLATAHPAAMTAAPPAAAGAVAAR